MVSIIIYPPNKEKHWADYDKFFCGCRKKTLHIYLVYLISSAFSQDMEFTACPPYWWWIKPEEFGTMVPKIYPPLWTSTRELQVMLINYILPINIWHRPPQISLIEIRGWKIGGMDRGSFWTFLLSNFSNSLMCKYLQIFFLIKKIWLLFHGMPFMVRHVDIIGFGSFQGCFYSIYEEN